MTTLCICIAEHFLRDLTYIRPKTTSTTTPLLLSLFSEHPAAPFSRRIMSAPFSPASSLAEAEPYNISHLDALLTTYLSHLDSYSTLRTTLSSSLSSAHLSLAQAQRSALLPPGQRYGQDMYDERMKAGRRVQIQKDGALAYQHQQNHPKTTEEKEKPEKLEHQEDANKSSSPKATPQKPPRDPLRQFGILTPQPLRQCQSSFISAATVIPELINTSRKMGELEREIEEVRKALGLNNIDGEDADVEAVEDTETAEPDTEEKNEVWHRGVKSQSRDREC
jgi:coiled-coil domain-containing protein 115